MSLAPYYIHPGVQDTGPAEVVLPFYKGIHYHFIPSSF